MNARQHAEIERRAHALRRAELARLATDLACLARRFIATLKTLTLKGTPTFTAVGREGHLPCR